MKGKDIEGTVAPVSEKVLAVKRSIAALVGKIKTGGEQLSW